MFNVEIFGIEITNNHNWSLRRIFYCNKVRLLSRMLISPNKFDIIDFDLLKNLNGKNRTYQY